ncbi:MAG: hypothetical protein ACPGWR_07710 [Ardenticatenaceae bacterium]
MDKARYENSNETTLLRFTRLVDISETLTVLFVVGALVGLVIGLMRGSWLEVLIFSSSIPPVLAFLGLLVIVVVKVISSIFAPTKTNNQRHDQKDIADPIV